MNVLKKKTLGRYFLFDKVNAFYVPTKCVVDLGQAVWKACASKGRRRAVLSLSYNLYKTLLGETRGYKQFWRSVCES